MPTFLPVFQYYVLLERPFSSLCAKAFPQQAQVAPLFGFTQTPGGIFSGGNFYGVMPYEGRYDADYGNILLPEKNGNFKTSSLAKWNIGLKGEVRDIKKIHTAKGDIYAVATRVLR